MSARRRLLAAVALAPLLVRAQAATRRRVAFVGFAGLFPGPTGLDEVIRALAARGYAHGGRIEVVRVAIEVSLEEERGRGLAYLVPLIERQLLPLAPDVIVVVGSIMTKGVSVATRTIPVVGSASDPVELGVAASLARPGGNVTGLAGSHPETSLKAMELMRSLVPRLARIGVFHDARPSATKFAGKFEQAAKALGVEAVMVPALAGPELVRAMQAIPARRIQAGVMAWLPPDSAEAFLREAAAMRLPLLGVNDEDVERGALLAYTSTDAAFAVRMAAMVEQVVRGADPATLAIQLPQTFRLVLNRGAATALGLAVPAELVLRADRVIG
jgi:putative ABC transport system substrate-binding protein